DSLATLKRALTIEEAAYPPDHPNIAATLTNIGNTQQLLGDYKDSLATLQRALTIKEATYPPDHPEIAITLTNIGSTQRRVGWSGG
ncbi:MAG: tetratricopeptide repeat protein, partial [Actinomycetota bacterium]